MLQLVQGQRKVGEGREGGTWEGEGEGKEDGGIQKSEDGEIVQRATHYILFYPLDMTRVYESFGII